ncbi:RNA polymerase sigma factor [Cellulomonas sp. Y8]|uniref:RNA polymerase sigma factor n=1 Tax=Cellulomonas sp. Y8 TaxID=2591145 RepID=UPI003D7345BE
MSADDAALTDALAAAAPDVLRYLERRLGPDDAADALGDVLLVAWRRAGDRPEAADATRLWLFGIARNTVLTARRTRARRVGLVSRLIRQPAAQTQPAADRGLEVRDAIDRLDPDLAEVVRLVHWEGLTLAEAALVLDQPPSTLRSRYRRARDELRAALTERGAAAEVEGSPRGRAFLVAANRRPLDLEGGG